MFSQVFLIIYTVAALISIFDLAEVVAVPPQSTPNSLLSPCPELFQYEPINKTGQWTGSLVVRSEHDIRGVWIRLVFDKKINAITIDSLFDIKIDEDNKQARVHNRNLLLKAQTEKVLKITVLYDEPEIPSLLEYRLNARTICPQDNINRQDVFLGDSKSDYFLSSLNSSAAIIPEPTEYKCGIPHASNPHPWQASIFVKINNVEHFTCEATLINPNYIITAAHCVTFKNEKTVIPRAFVSVYLGPDGASKDAVQSYIADINVHPGYDAGSLLDDIAILKLASPIKVTDNLRPICLGERKLNDTKRVIVGHEVLKDGQIGKLLESNVLTNNSNECKTLAPFLQGALNYETYCISYGSDDKNCVGNSGSGLITTYADGRANLDGIVILGIRLQNKKECDQNANIVVYKIVRYLSWIKSIIY